MSIKILTLQQKNSIANYKRMGITISILDNGKVEVCQNELINNYILNQEQLKERGKEIFPDAELLPVTHVPEIEKIDAEWIRNKMKEFGIELTDISKQLAIDKKLIALMLNGSEQLNNSLKAALYFYFMTYELNRDFRAAGTDMKKTR
ncbi:hypothetical protein ORI89_08360 [Sphingobacterium sp. UT-1RO-CII-1]|uniref:hypothetical protein n=1 Tax=Sphingobacterium sp. UT-1RO-CII-1 TaxID=2995225 RepID=UPI00227C35C6|nr:hypothetical protein [Sphingobacterium sp. UT-1RO-CII-1]MCY4779662.1 hypothetical protein [Sphingobacterium sp. UT-1RO-CII-1]